MKHQWSDKIQVCYKTIAHCHLISFYIKDFFFTGTCVHVTGTINPSGTGTTYYYGQNRFAARFPPESRKLETEVAKMKEIDAEDRRTVRERLSRDTGYTGLSILHCVNSLYGFDVIRDIVFDVMHNLPLNIVGCSLKQLIAEGKLDVKDADERLSNFPWTASIFYIDATTKRIMD